MALIFNEEETKKIQEEQLLNFQNEAKQSSDVDKRLSEESTSAQDFFKSAKKAKSDWNASYFDKPVQDNLDSIVGSDTYNNLVRADNMLTFIQKEMGDDYSVGGSSVAEVKSLLRSHGDTLNPMAVNRLNNIITSEYNKARDHRNIFEEAGAYLSRGISNMTDAHTANALYAQYANASTEEEREAAKAKLISFSKDTQDRSVLNPSSFDSYDNVSGFADHIGYMLQEAFTLAPQVITTTALNVIPYVGTAASIGVLGSQMIGESILRQVSDGLDPNFWVALGEGAADTALERLTFGGGGKITKMFNRAIPSASAKRAGKQALRHNFTVSGIKDFGKGIAGEVATEEAQYLTDLAARKVQTGKWLAEGQTWSDVGAEMKEIGIATAFGVMPMQAVGSASNERRYARELKKANMRLADQPIMQNVASYAAAGGFSSLSDNDRIRVNNALTYQNTLAATENALDNFDLYAERLGAKTTEGKEKLRQRLEQDRDGAKASLELVLNESNQAVKDIFTAYTSNYDYDNINGVVPDDFRATNNFSWEGILNNFKPVNNVEGNQNIGIATDPQTGIRVVLHKFVPEVKDGPYNPDFSVIEEGDVVEILPPEGGIFPANFNSTFDYNDYMSKNGESFDINQMLDDITESAQQLNRYNEHRHQSLSKKAEEIADLVKGYNHNAVVRVVTSVNDLIDDMDIDEELGNQTNDAKFVLAGMLANNPTSTGFTVTQDTINKLIERGLPGDLLGPEGTIYVVADRVKTNLDLISTVRHEAVHSEIQKYLTTQGIEEADIKRAKDFIARFGSDYDESLARLGETGNVESTLMNKMRVAVINYLDKHGYRKSGTKAPTMAECVSFLADIYAKNAQTQGTTTAATVGIDIMRNPTPVAEATTVGEDSSITPVEQPTEQVMSREAIDNAFDNYCKELNISINGMLDSLTSPTTPESAKPELVSRMQTAIQSASFLTGKQKNYLMSLVSNPSNPNVKNSVDAAFGGFVSSDIPAEFVRQMQGANTAPSVAETPQPVASSTPTPPPASTPTPTPISTPTNVNRDVPVNTPEVSAQDDTSRQYLDINSFAPIDTSKGESENKSEGGIEKELKGKTQNTIEGKTKNQTPSKTSVSGIKETEVAPRPEEKNTKNNKNSTKTNNTPKNSGKEKPSTEKTKAEKQKAAMEASSSEDSNVRLSAASNQDAAYKTLYELTEDEDDAVSAQAWETIRTKRINDSKSKAKTNLSMQLVEKVIEGPEDGKIALASFPEKSIEGFSVYYLVQILATDSSPAVRMAIAKNNSLPNYVLQNIAKYDSDQDVRKAAQNSLDTQSKEQPKNTDKNKDKPNNSTSKEKESKGKPTSPKTNKGKNNTKSPEESKEKEPLSNPEDEKGDVPTEEEKTSEQSESNIDVEKLSVEELEELDKSTLLKYVKTYKNPEIACALALKFFDEGKFKEGRRWLNQSIKNNSVSAIYVLGSAYITGDYGYEINYKKAVKYLEEAEAKNYARAIFELGVLYFYGQGVEQNYRIAKTKFNKAAYRGDALSNLFLSEIFRKGLGVKVDLDKANALLEKAEQLSPGISEEVEFPETEETGIDESQIDSSTETEETSSDTEETSDTSSEEQQEENTDNESTTENVISESDIDYIDDELDDLDDDENNPEGADAEPVGTLPKQHYIRNRRLQKILNSIMSVWKIVFDDEIREDGTRIHMFKAEGNKHFKQRRSYLNKLLEINKNEDKLAKQKERLFDYLVNINKWKNWLSNARIVSDRKIEKNREKQVKYWDMIASLKTKYNIPKEEQLEAAIDIELTNWENALNEATTWLGSSDFKKTLISSDVPQIEAAQEEIRNCLEDIKTIRKIYEKKPNLKAMFVDMAQGRARWGKALSNNFVETKQDITNLLAKQPLVLKELEMGGNSEFSLHEQQKAGEDLERNQRDIDEATNIFKSIKDISENDFQDILYTALDQTPLSMRKRSFANYVEAWQRFKKNNGEGPLTAEQIKQYSEILEKVNSLKDSTDHVVDQETSDFFNKHGPDTLFKYLTYLKNKYKNASKEHSRLSFSTLLKILGQEKSARAYLDAETELQKTLPEKIKIRDDNEFNKFVEVTEKNAATVQENKAKAKADAEKFSSKYIYNTMNRTEFESQPYWRVISGLSRDTLSGLKKTSLWGNLHKKLDTVYD
jgi:TPR repeat protein